MPVEQRGRPRKERFNIYFAPEQLDRLDLLSERTGLTIAEHVRRAVDGYLRENGVDPVPMDT